MNRYFFRYESMKSVKSRQIDKRNECVIDFYRLIDTIESNQSIKSDLPIFIDASIDKSTLIFIDWLLRAKYKFIL